MRHGFTVYLRWPNAWLFEFEAATLAAARKAAKDARERKSGETLSAMIVCESTRQVQVQSTGRAWRDGGDARSYLLVE